MFLNLFSNYLYLHIPKKKHELKIFNNFIWESLFLNSFYIERLY